jgi:hypothetical protein
MDGASDEVRVADVDQFAHNAEAQYQAQMHGASLNKALQVHTGKDGKARWLFMNLPADVASLLQLGLNTALPVLNEKGAGFVYEKTRDIWKNNLGKHASSHKAGLNAAMAFSTLLIGLEPLDKLINVRRSYTEERKDLMESIAPVLHSTNKDLKQNEVLAAALDRVHDHAMTRLKRFAAQLPSLAAISAYAVMDYGKLKKQKNLEHAAEQLVENTTATHDNIDAWLEQQTKFRDKFKGKTNPMTDRPFTDEEINAEWQRQRDRLHDQWDEAREKSGKDDSLLNSNTTLKTLSMTVLAGAGGVLENRAMQSNKKYKDSIALDMVLDLASEVENSSGRAASAMRIMEIFQQNERDHGRAPIGEKLQEKLLPAAEMIAELIADERLNPLALINLVGDNKIVMHGKNGSRRFADEQTVQKLLDDQLKLMASRELMSAEEFFANFADPKLVESTLKQNLAELKGLDLARFASLFPDDILERAGLRKKEITALRTKAHNEMYELVAGAVMDMAHRDPELLKQNGLNDENIDQIREFAARLEQEGLNAAKQVVDGKDKSMLDIIRTEMLSEQMRTGKNPWVERVSSAKAATEELKKQQGGYANNEEVAAKGHRHRYGSRADGGRYADMESVRRGREDGPGWDRGA